MQDFAALAIGLLVLDCVSKFFMLGYLTAYNGSLARDWLLFTAIQTGGVLVASILAIRLLKIKAAAFAYPAITVAACVAFTLLFTAFQDYSGDGQMYHLQRVMMFPADWKVFNDRPFNPAVLYPLLGDNVRGLIVAATGAGPFSGVGVNVAIALAAMWFWQKYGVFLPAWIRWIPALGPVAAGQLMSYYCDGMIAGLGGILFLASMLAALAWKDAIGRQPRAVLANMGLPVMAFGLLAVLLFAQLKFAFPFLIATFMAPLLIVCALFVKADWRKVEGQANIEVASRWWLLAAGLVAGGALALANPYYILVKSAWGDPGYNDFSPAMIRGWYMDALVDQNVWIFGQDVPRYLRFVYANILSAWPGITPMFDGDGTASPWAIVRSLLVRLASVDSPFSGFGPFSALVLVGATCVAVQDMWKNGARFARSEGAAAVVSLLSLVLLWQLVLSVVYQLGWWPRMNPAIYTTACCLALIRVWAGFRGRLAGRLVAVGCILLLVVPLVTPPAILIARSWYDMRLLRQEGAALAGQLAQTPNRRLALPRVCGPQNNPDFQLSSAIKFLSAFPDKGLSAQFRDGGACASRSISVNTQQDLCYCAQ